MLLMIFISGHTPRNVETKLTWPVSLYHTYQTYANEGAYRGRGLSASSPFRPSGGGALQEHAYGRTISPNISWSPRDHTRDTPPSRPPELHVLEQGRAEKGPLFSEGACNLAIGANGECFRPSLCLEWLPQVQGPKMTSKLVCGV